MAYTRAQIEQKVKEKLDEVSQFDAYQVDAVEFIDKFMDSAAEKILLNMPLHLIPPSDFSSQPQDARSNGTGIVQLPDDYLRLSSFQMVEWDRPVVHAISKEHPAYNLQKNNVTRGKPSKPIAVVGHYLSSFTSGSGSGMVLAQGFAYPAYYSGAYGWEGAIPTNAQITAIIGDATEYTPIDNFLICDTTTNITYWVFSNGIVWNVNTATFELAQ